MSIESQPEQAVDMADEVRNIRSMNAISFARRPNMTPIQVDRYRREMAVQDRIRMLLAEQTGL